MKINWQILDRSTLLQVHFHTGIILPHFICLGECILPTLLILSKVCFPLSFVSWRHEYLKPTVFIKNIYVFKCFMIINSRHLLQYLNSVINTEIGWRKHISVILLNDLVFLFVKCFLFFYFQQMSPKSLWRNLYKSLHEIQMKIHILLFCPVLFIIFYRSLAIRFE